MFAQEQVEQFEREGYTVYPNFLNADEVAALLQEAAEVTAGSTRANHDATRMEMEPNQPPDGTAVRRIYEPCSFYPVTRALSELDRLLDCVEQLLGPNLIYHYSKTNMKPAAVGSVVEWHQDLSYYPLTNKDSLAILFYLDDTRVENGALRMLPGRQDDFLLEHSEEGFFQGRVTEAVDEEGVVTVEGEAGTAIFMHGLTPHSSAPNTSESPRRTLILSYRAADAYPVYCGEMTHKTETYSRLVRGEQARMARFEMNEFPIPQYKDSIVSLYDLQERSREGEMK